MSAPTALPSPGASPSEWLGCSLGERTVAWTSRDAILFALAVGARADQLSLVYEDRLRVLPPFALTLAQWAPDVLGAAGAFDIASALHGAQRLDVHRRLPSDGEAVLSARVDAVWDKGSAAVYDVTASCEYFTATWSLFAPGHGGFGGERGPGRPAAPSAEPDWGTEVSIAQNAAALYRLLGDRHRIHIDPAAARGIGQPRPILHGLATLAAGCLAAAERLGVHPADLCSVSARFSGVVFPGDSITVRGWDADRAGIGARGPAADFDIHTGRGPAVSGGHLTFDRPAQPEQRTKT
ncbi:MaoC/PaaZ C-terminal domain-containing protein [Tsukamurella sp. 8F]|uniref:MaoC/PaaZ C-terminal domain-containing protein n=1 Tax=unclassified Tsukamurella TaxID=2633480 RepID=UPI0023B9F407|nr:MULTISPECIES: MaoC/PaaZ C-terminal domain-containing protein [unclassified Tsukamurella]MDF0528366.1 MaoC/PaaZ C-terminal domain-containing protein [Tsukamurella sp. 8J]MDF0586191.1 MaoC/PaaZ C-terminal domain-containing protein [Tsukamurella sp. 8F]